MSTLPFLEVSELSVHLPTGCDSFVHAVQSVTFTVDPGQRVGIVGESGSGKSVTGRAIAGLLPENPRIRVTGSIKFDQEEYLGRDERTWDTVRTSKVGMIFQDPLTYLNPTRKIGWQVEESVRLGGMRVPKGQAKDMALRTLELAGLADPERVASIFPHELSGGMRQRVLVAIAIAKRPSLIIADEPTTALDATVQERVLDTLDDTVATLGTSMILISHDLAVVAGRTDHIVVMWGGRVVEYGPTVRVMEKPQHPYTEALLRSVKSLVDQDIPLYSITPDLRRWLAAGGADITINNTGVSDVG